MKKTRRVLSRFVALFLTMVMVGATLAVTTTLPPAAAAPIISIRGSTTADVAQITAWFRATTRSPYRATVSVEQLATYFLTEGAAANVRGDIAFVQAVLETGWFSFPAGGYVQPGDNNFGGIGAYGDGSHLFRAPSAQIGARAQVQLLRRYADPSASQYNIGYPPVAELWNPASRYDVPGGTHGWAPNWNDLSGRWASSTTYADSIFRLYDSMMRFSGRSILDVTNTPSGALDGATVLPSGIRATGWAIAPGTSNPINVDLYLNGTMLGRVLASGVRPDVGAAFPPYGPNHGYDVTLPVVGAGALCAYGIDPNGGTNPLFGCRAVNSAPSGSLDGATISLTGVRATGWALAPTTSNPINVDFYMNGIMVARVFASGSRPDVAAAFPSNGGTHGYDVTLPVTGGTLCAYAIDPNVGPNPSIGCRSIPGAPPVGSLDGAALAPGGIRLNGWTAAPGTTGPISVDVYINGTMIGRYLAAASRSDVGAAFPLYGTSHGYDLTIPGSGGTVCAYGIDPTGPHNRLLGPGCKTV